MTVMSKNILLFLCLTKEELKLKEELPCMVIKNINPEDNTKFKCEMLGSFSYKVDSTVQLIVAGM